MNSWLAVLGVCFPIYFLPAIQAAEKNGLLGSREANPLSLKQQQPRDELLHPDLAFIPTVTAADAKTLVVRWAIAEGCYLYRDKLQLSIVGTDGIRIADLDIPAGIPKDDEFFGPQQVFYKSATITAHLQGKWPERGEIEVQLSYQGCAEIGVCYPPIVQTIPVAAKRT